jgi:hypothetical protein
MKSKFSFVLVSLIIVSSLILGFVLTDNSPNMKTPGNHTGTSNNPITVFGPPLMSPLAVLAESFESTTFPPAGWIKITPTGGTGWARQLNGVTPVPGFNGGNITVPVGGGTAVAFANYLTGGTTTCDQWIISPKLSNIQAGDSLSFWLRKFGNYLDNFNVKISTTTPTVAAMTVSVYANAFQPADSGWVQYKFNIGGLVPPGSNIYIGFREWVLDPNLDGASFSLDLVASTAQLTEVQNENITPNSYKLNQNYPNPFNPSTSIEFAVASKGFVSLKVFDILGKEVATLVNEVKDAGTYSLNFNAAKLTSGVYFYRIQTDKFTDMKSMVLVK